MNTILHCGDKHLDLGLPIIMGILNLTPDSFSDGGQFDGFDAAIKHARQMVDDGAKIIDVGGESTRPGAQAVSVQQELDRVIPVIEKLSQSLSAVISIDTNKASVMQAAVAAGAGFINDVWALQKPDTLRVVAELCVPICLMHMQGSPRTMQKAPEYADVVAEIDAFFRSRIAACETAGIDKQRILLDPGFGFGKSLEHNLELLRNLSAFKKHDLPLLAGVSRKRMLGVITGAEVDQRIHASVAAAVIAAANGANILRVHDVKATRDALLVQQAVYAGR